MNGIIQKPNKSGVMLEDRRENFLKWLKMILRHVPEEMGFRIFTDHSGETPITKAICIGRDNHSNDPYMSFMFDDDADSMTVRYAEINKNRIMWETRAVLKMNDSGFDRNTEILLDRYIQDTFPVMSDTPYEKLNPIFVDDFVDSMESTFIDDDGSMDEYEDFLDDWKTTPKDDGIDNEGNNIGEFFRLSALELQKVIEKDTRRMIWEE